MVGIAIGGTTHAYWTSPTPGSGAGATGTTTVAISATTSGVSGLYPGASVPVAVTVKNNSTTAGVKITSLVQSGATVIQTPGKGTCNAGVVSFTAGTLPSGTLAAGQSTTAPGTVQMTAAAADGCQGTTFAITLLAGGRTS